LRMIKLRSGRAPALPRGRWCAPDRRLSFGRHPPLCRGQSLRPRWNIPPAGVTLTRRQRRFTHSPITPRRLAAAQGPGTPNGVPADLLLARRPRVEQGPLRLRPRASHPAVIPRRTPRRRQAIAHWPGYYTLNITISRASTGASHLHSCTLTSHVVGRRLHDHSGDADLPQPVAHHQQRPGHRLVGGHLL